MNKILFKNFPSKETPLNAQNLNQMQTNIENAINSITPTTQQGKLKIGNILIQWGVLSNVIVPASSYTQYEVTFPETYTSTPEVFIQSKGNYNIIAQVAYNNTASTFINVRSNDGTERTGRNFAWLAIGIKQ